MKNFYLLFFVSLLLFSCNQRGTKNSDDNNLSPIQKIRSIKDEVSYTDIEGNMMYGYSTAYYFDDKGNLTERRNWGEEGESIEYYKNGLCIKEVDVNSTKTVDYIYEDSQVSVSVAAGNEGAAQHHYTAELDYVKNQDTVELRIADKEEGFSMEFWGDPPDDYGISLQSPAGEKLYVSSSLGAGTQELSFIFVETKVLVNYVKMERMTGKQLIYFRFFHPAAGIWKVNVSKKGISGSRFHMWLPVQGLISPDTYFLESTPYITVTAPGDSTRGITATAYQYLDNSLDFQAGRGCTPNNQVTPDLAAPGVDLLIPLPGGAFGKASGSSLSSAVVAGAAALVQEWAIVRGNIPYASGNTVKFYLQKGAVREEQMEYPNPGWGYGRLDLYRTFEIIN